MQQFIPKYDEMIELPEELLSINIPRKLLKLLYHRGFDSKRKIEEYLHPNKDNLHNPFLMHDMDKAVTVIQDALEHNEAISIFGDYDVDGVTATSILYTWLRKQGAKVDYYIPDRHGEGYGLNMPAIEKIASISKLLITVDCGITSCKEVSFAKQLGMQVIVTDHHQIGEEIPKCEAVINPLLGNYPFKKICGAGVAFKLVQALGGDTAVEGMWDLVALATIADIVPLIDENRVFVTYGLQQMATTKRPGFQALFKTADLKGPPSSTDIAFRIAPRINAGGRLAIASRAVRLLTTPNEQEAAQIALELNEHNERRKQLELEIFEQANHQVQIETDFLNDRVLIVCGENWESGVVGLVASRLVERYHWPAIVFSSEGEICVGSARSIPGVNIYEMLSLCGDLFIRFGGHSQAAGCTIEKKNISLLKQRLSNVIKANCDEKAFIPTKEYDIEVSQDELTEEFVRSFNVMQPVGYENTLPIFLLSCQTLSEVRMIGKDNSHLRLTISSQGSSINGVWFRMGQMAASLPHTADVLTGLSINEWQGKTSVQCEIKAVRSIAPQKSFQILCEARKTELDKALIFELANSSVNEESPLTEAAFEKVFPIINQRIVQNIQGTIIVAHTFETIKNNAAQIALLLSHAESDFCFYTPEDNRGYNAVIVMPRWKDIFKPELIILLDGVISDNEKTVMSTQFPNAKIISLVSTRGSYTGFLSRVLLNIEQLREVYRKMRTLPSGKENLIVLSQITGFTESAIVAALIIFEQAGLITLNRETFEYELLPARKGKPESTPLFCNLVKLGGKGQ